MCVVQVLAALGGDGSWAEAEGGVSSYPEAVQLREALEAKGLVYLQPLHVSQALHKRGTRAAE